MIGLFYGTRPEYIKLLPIISSLEARKVEFLLYQVQQHTNLLDGCAWHRKIIVEQHTKNRLNNISISIMKDGLVELDRVLVQGDTTTATAVALSAFHNNIPVHHVEAGLRTYDKKNPYPEEVNRRIISSIASVHYCPTDRDSKNLYDEGLGSDCIIITGNTVIDNLQGIFPTKSNTIIVTMHRRENQDDLDSWFRQIEKLAVNNSEYEFIFPMHPSPQVQKHRSIFNKVRVIDAVDHDTMLNLLASAYCVITDSGGIQEECSYFRKPCFVCRKVTERPCSGQILCSSPEALYNNFNKTSLSQLPTSTPFGDGKAGDRIAEHLQRY